MIPQDASREPQRRMPGRASAGDNASPPAVQPSEHAAACGAAGEFTCLFCGTVMLGGHCKLSCPNCGYREDCSDLFRV